MTRLPSETALGPVLVGTFLNVALWGVCLVQFYMYLKSARRDSLWVRTFIYLLFLADTLQTLFIVIGMYKVLVIGFGKFSSIVRVDWLAATDPALTGIIGGAVQIFLVRRLRILTKNWFVVTIVLICATTTILMGIAAGAAVHFVPEYAHFRKFKAVVIVWLVSAIIGDILITVHMVTYLQKQRSAFIKTNTYIDNIIRLTIQTGLLTSAWAIVDLALFLANPTALHLVFNLSLSKLYSNSLMSSLNARDVWKYGSSVNETDITSIPGLGSTMGNITLTQTGTLQTHGRHNTEVFVQVEQTRARGSVDISKMALEDDTIYEKENDTKADAYNKV